MRNAQTRTVRSLLMLAVPLAVLGLLAACASAPDHPAPDQPDWIRIGVTTKDEVMQRYGQPDMVIASPDGDTAIYRPPASGQSAPRVEIPTVQAGPLGSATTRMEPINPGLGANDMNRKTNTRVRSEIRIRYDARGVVQELSSP
jgi:hypothetical protein